MSSITRARINKVTRVGKKTRQHIRKEVYVVSTKTAKHKNYMIKSVKAVTAIK